METLRNFGEFIFNKPKCLLGMLGAALVISGVALKNGYAKESNYSEKSKKAFDGFGTTFYIVGFLIFTYVLAFENLTSPSFDKKSLVAIGGFIAIFIAVMMKDRMKNPTKNTKNLMYALYILGWLAFGFSCGVGRGENEMNLTKAKYGILAAIFVIISMLSTLPHESENKITYGLGMPLYTIAWVMLVCCCGCSFGNEE